MMNFPHTYPQVRQLKRKLGHSALLLALAFGCDDAGDENTCGGSVRTETSSFEVPVDRVSQWMGDDGQLNEEGCEQVCLSNVDTSPNGEIQGCEVESTEPKMTESVEITCVVDFATLCAPSS